MTKKMFLITGSIIVFSLFSYVQAENVTRVKPQTLQEPKVQTPIQGKTESQQTVKKLRPDLTIQQMKITPANPTINDVIQFKAFVTNVGAVDAPPSKAGIRIGGETNPMVWQKPAITPNSSNAIVRNKQITKGGRYRVTFIADVDGDVDESNEQNNERYLEFTVKEPLPDITLKDPEIKPANPTTNDMIRFEARVINIGQVASPPLRCGVRVGGEAKPPSLGYYGGIPVDSPQAQKFAVARVLKLTKPGNYSVTFMVDVLNEVNELNENNNQITLHFSVQ